MPERVPYVLEPLTGTARPTLSHETDPGAPNRTVNSLDDWCIFAPPQPGPDSVIGNTERIEVAWCTADGHGTRLIPDGSITGAHFVQTPDYVQITGVGDLTKINIPAGDEGGELDPHGADGNGEYPETRNARYRCKGTLGSPRRMEHGEGARWRPPLRDYSGHAHAVASTDIRPPGPSLVFSASTWT